MPTILRRMENEGWNTRSITLYWSGDGDIDYKRIVRKSGLRGMDALSAYASLADEVDGME